MIVFTENYFHLSTENSSYIIRILPDGMLNHCYYGSKISETRLDFYNLYQPFDYTAPYTIGDKVTTIDALPHEFPFQGRGLYRTPAAVIENFSGRAVNQFIYISHKIYEGAPALAGLPHLDKNTKDCQTLEIILKDIITDVKVHLFYAVFEQTDVIARHSVVENSTENDVKIQNIMSLIFDFEDSDFELVTLYGRWANERTAERYDLHRGNTIISSTRGSIGHQTCPFAALVRKDTTEDFGEAYGLSLIYSGDFEIGAQIGQFDGVRLYAGLNRETFSWSLKSGESFVTPQAVITYSNKGIGQMSRNFHNMCRSHLGACALGKKHPIVLNLWEAFYFDVEEQKVLDSIDSAKELGIDTLVVDDGWFGTRHDETSSLGDWLVNKQKFPNGFEHISKRCKEAGLKLGLWFEPEVISPNSELYRKHPNWCVHIDGIDPVKSRSELVLDFSCEDVVDGVYEIISDVLRKYDISYMKWDMNRNMTDNGSVLLGSKRQYEHSHRHMLGVYSLMKRFNDEFPDIFFEGSAGGGGRFDFGMLYYMPQLWTSDNSDAIGRLDIQHGTSMLFPPEAISCHVSECPNHQTGRVTPIETRENVAQLFSFGYELNINKFTKETREIVKKQIAKHRLLDEWLPKSSFYRILSPLENDACAWQAVSSDKSQSAVLFAVKLTRPRLLGRYLRLKGLDPNKRYSVKPLDITANGDVLMNAGIPINEEYPDFGSTLFEINEV